MTDDYCGYEDTTTGHPCRHPKGSCPIPSHKNAVANGGNPQGRDPKLTKDRQEQIASMIEQGKSITSACRMAGIDRASFYNWIDRGEGETNSVYAEFFDRITRARGHSENQYFETIFDLATQEGDLATLMSMLKQRHPDSWGDVNRGEQSGGVIIHTDEPEEFEIDDETLEAKRE